MMKHLALLLAMPGAGRDADAFEARIARLALDCVHREYANTPVATGSRALPPIWSRTGESGRDRRLPQRPGFPEEPENHYYFQVTPWPSRRGGRGGGSR